jgi:hypothetical protein
MNKLNLKNFGLFLIILSITVLFSCSFNLFGGGKTPESDEEVRTDYCAEYEIDCDVVEEKELWQGSIEDMDFFPGIFIILNKKASFDFDKTYKRKDFPELKDFPEIAREDIMYEKGTVPGLIEDTQFIIKQVIKQLESKKNNDFSEIQREISSGMMIDVDKFRRVLYLKVDPNHYSDYYPNHLTIAREHAFNAIKLLENRKDVIYVGPGSSFGKCMTNGYSRGYASLSGSFEGLSIERERQVKQAYIEYQIRRGYYWNVNKEKINELIDRQFIPRYLGNYNGYVAVEMTASTTLDGAVHYGMNIDGIHFNDTILYAFPIAVVSEEGEYYLLREAYDLEFLTREDLKNIAYFWHGGVELN